MKTDLTGLTEAEVALIEKGLELLKREAMADYSYAFRANRQADMSEAWVVEGATRRLIQKVREARDAAATN